MVAKRVRERVDLELQSDLDHVQWCNAESKCLSVQDVHLNKTRSTGEGANAHRDTNPAIPPATTTWRREPWSLLAWHSWVRSDAVGPHL